MGRTGRRRPPAEVAAARIGTLERRWAPWAAESYDHANAVWEAARRAVTGRAWALAQMVGPRNTLALQGQIDLSLLHLIGQHLDSCTDCWERWTDGYRPGDLITAAVRRRPAGQVLRAIEHEQRANKRQSTRR